MAKFISISGPATTGKTSIINSLSTYTELSNAVFSPDVHELVWNELVDKGLFSEFTEISTDYDYLCTFITCMIDKYTEYLESFKDSDKLVILDGCWLDLSIYSVLNMWYTRVVKSVQESILSRVAYYDPNILRIYITTAEDDKYPVRKDRIRGRISAFRMNRPLESRYYNIAKNLKNAVALPSSDTTESSLFIIEDLKNLGYL